MIQYRLETDYNGYTVKSEFAGINSSLFDMIRPIIVHNMLIHYCFRTAFHGISCFYVPQMHHFVLPIKLN